MDPVAAGSRGGSQVLADVVVADPRRSTGGGHGDNDGARRTRCTVGGGDEGWELTMAVTSQMTPLFRLQ